jgi:hypothetical protein
MKQKMKKEKDSDAESLFQWPSPQSAEDLVVV